MGHLTGEPKPFQHGKLHSEKKQNPEISLCQLHTQSHLTTSARSPTYPTSGTNSNFPAPTIAEKNEREGAGERERVGGGGSTSMCLQGGERGEEKEKEKLVPPKPNFKGRGF